MSPQARKSLSPKRSLSPKLSDDPDPTQSSYEDSGARWVGLHGGLRGTGLRTLYDKNSRLPQLAGGKTPAYDDLHTPGYVRQAYRHGCVGVGPPYLTEEAENKTSPVWNACPLLDKELDKNDWNRTYSRMQSRGPKSLGPQVSIRNLRPNLTMQKLPPLRKKKERRPVASPKREQAPQAEPGSPTPSVREPSVAPSEVSEKPSEEETETEPPPKQDQPEAPPAKEAKHHKRVALRKADDEESKKDRKQERRDSAEIKAEEKDKKKKEKKKKKKEEEEQPPEEDQSPEVSEKEQPKKKKQEEAPPVDPDAEPPEGTEEHYIWQMEQIKKHRAAAGQSDKDPAKKEKHVPRAKAGSRQASKELSKKPTKRRTSSLKEDEPKKSSRRPSKQGEAASSSEPPPQPQPEGPAPRDGVPQYVSTLWQRSIDRAAERVYTKSLWDEAGELVFGVVQGVISAESSVAEYDMGRRASIDDDDGDRSSRSRSLASVYIPPKEPVHTSEPVPNDDAANAQYFNDVMLRTAHRVAQRDAAASAKEYLEEMAVTIVRALDNEQALTQLNITLGAEGEWAFRTPSCSPGVTPGDTPGDTPTHARGLTPSLGATPGPTPGDTPGLTPQQTPAATPPLSTPGQTPGATPGPSRGPTPGASPDITPGQTPGATPGVTPAVSRVPSLHATPGGTPGITPGQGPTPRESSSATPGPTPGATPGATPGMSPAPTPPQAATPLPGGTPVPGGSPVPGTTPVLSRRTTPVASPVPGATPGPTPGASPLPGPSPKASPGATPGGTPGATPGGTPGATPPGATPIQSHTPRELATRELVIPQQPMQATLTGMGRLTNTGATRQQVRTFAQSLTSSILRSSKTAAIERASSYDRTRAYPYPPSQSTAQPVVPGYGGQRAPPPLMAQSFSQPSFSSQPPSFAPTPQFAQTAQIMRSSQFAQPSQQFSQSAQNFAQTPKFAQSSPSNRAAANVASQSNPPVPRAAFAAIEAVPTDDNW
eukprot:gnl/TRDRNA2_/TRDRNA2_168554_c6_seq1.p1 gnl/TRDRNA2_/TRDRNA2_168554_c6~~gnl/TRDRNA2_/TRDRNA2_168554_c6_seq1.p1  ORF type:complete len:1144 (-),score=216.75 gnl/TRDRNA2_/TRDRNA2_168554_c6_seq1:130-3102(-)